MGLSLLGSLEGMMWLGVFSLKLDETEFGGREKTQTGFIRTFRDKSPSSRPISKRDDAEQLTVQGDGYQQGRN